MSSLREAKQHAVQMLRRCLQVLLKAPSSLGRVCLRHVGDRMISSTLVTRRRFRRSALSGATRPKFLSLISQFSHQLSLGENSGYCTNQSYSLRTSFPAAFTRLSPLAAVMTAMQAEGEESAELNRDAQLGQHSCLQGCVYVRGRVCVFVSMRLCVCACVCAREWDKKLMWQ